VANPMREEARETLVVHREALVVLLQTHLRQPHTLELPTAHSRTTEMKKIQVLPLRRHSNKAFTPSQVKATAWVAEWLSELWLGCSLL